MNGIINIVQNFTGTAQKVIAVWYENSAPLAEIGRRVFNPPHTISESWSVENLNPVMHQVKFYLSSDGVTLETLSVILNVDASQRAVQAFEVYYYKVGRGNQYDPVHGTSELRDPRLLNMNYKVEFRGESFRIPGVHFVDRSDAGGGFDLIGNVFNHDEEFCVTVNNSQSFTPPTAGSSDYIDVKVLAADAVFDNTFYKKVIVAAFPGVGSIGTITFPTLATIPNTKVKFTTHGGNQRYMKLQLAVGDTINLNGAAVNKIYLRKGEVIEILFKGGVAYISDAKIDDHTAGEVIMADKKLLNTEYADGTEYNIADVQPVYDNLDPSRIVSYAQWNEFTDVTIGKNTKRYYKNRGKFAVDLVAGKIKFPDVREQSFRILKTFDGAADAQRLSNGANGMQSRNYDSHDHDIKGQDNDAGATGSASNEVANVENPDAPTAFFTRKTVASGGTETRVDNLGKYGLVRL